MSGLVIHRGGCHCGRVRFEVEAPARVEADACNCSICERVGYLHLIVPAARFRLVSGGDDLQTYTFGTGTAKHSFCRVCGIKAHYVPRSHPDGVSVNARCLDPETLEALVVRGTFDGRHWEEHVHELAPLDE